MTHCGGRTNQQFDTRKSKEKEEIKKKIKENLGCLPRDACLKSLARPLLHTTPDLLGFLLGLFSLSFIALFLLGGSFKFFGLSTPSSSSFEEALAMKSLGGASELSSTFTIEDNDSTLHT